MVAQTRGSGTAGGVPLPKKLQFREKLVGKGYSADVLLKKLKALHQELAEMDQEHVDTKSLGAVRKELIQVQVLLHKDKGVKAFVACCLADILRLYAPDAPYTADELRDIFQFFFRQLATGLKGSNSPYYNEYFHLLQSLSTVKSVVLVCDLHHADELMAEIFRDSFILVRNDLAKNIEICIIDILIALVDEAQTVPHSVLDSIMAQFLDKNARLDQPAYRVAVEVCNATADKLQRYVCQYFTDVIIQHSKHDDLDEIRKAHSLIVRVNRDCPSLLHNVVPQLEEELKVDDYEIRLLAAEVLGEMFADKGGGELAKKYPHVWDVWQGRRNDKSPGVRIAFIEACHGIIMHHPELRKPIEDALLLKLHDPDDKVRAVTCKVYSQIDFETALHCVSLEQLQAIGGRCLDKKPIVRAEALNTLGMLYSIARPEIEKIDPAAISQFSWIPGVVLHAAKIGGPPIRVMVEQILAQYIIPLPPKGEDEAAWTEQLLTVMKYLDAPGMVTLLNIAGLKQTRPTVFDRFIQYCEENNGGVIDENEAEITRKLNLVIQHIATLFPDRAQVAENLHTFAKLNETRLYKLFKTCTNTQTDLKTLVKATNEFLRRVEQTASSIVDTMTAILRKASLWVLNSSSIPPLAKRIERAAGEDAKAANPSEAERLARVANTALAHVSKHCPALYTLHAAEFSKALADETNVRLVEVALQALAALKWDSSDRRIWDRVVNYGLAAHARHAKFAARLIAHMKEREGLAVDLVNSIAESLPDAEGELLVAHLAALAEIAKLAPDAFEQQSDVIVRFLVNQVLMQPGPFVMQSDEDGEEWGPSGYELPVQTKTRLLSLKICRNRCIAYAGSEAALVVATPVIKMLLTILANGGSTTEHASDDVKLRSRMRLQAATCLVQMAGTPAYCDEITPNFALLSVTIQDPCFQVRMGFLLKLVAYLTKNKVDARFNTIIFLTAHDPEREVRDQARTYVSFALSRVSSETRIASFEMIFLRLLHLLAHHPDFAIETQHLQETAKYIEFYLDLVASADNIPLLYHLALKGKTVRDSTSQEASENLYCISELAQEIIKNRAKLNGWQLSSYPGRVKLPSDIFKGLANIETANKILKTVYLPEETASWLGELKKTAGSPNAKIKGRAGGEVGLGKKRKSPTKPRASGTAKKPQRKKRKADYEDDEDEENDDEPDGSDDDAASKFEPHASSADEEGDASEELGRGARGRAKRRAKREAKKQKQDKDGK